MRQVVAKAHEWYHALKPGKEMSHLQLMVPMLCQHGCSCCPFVGIIFVVLSVWIIPWHRVEANPIHYAALYIDRSINMIASDSESESGKQPYMGMTRELTPEEEALWQY